MLICGLDYLNNKKIKLFSIITVVNFLMYLYKNNQKTTSYINK